MSNLIAVHELGQSIWLDYIDRPLVTEGGLEELVRTGLRGVTSNPTIFHRAITASDAYDDAIRDLLQADPELDPETLYKWLAITDVQRAADILRPVWLESEGADGFVSLEVSPHLAYDPEATVDAARHLCKEVGRENLMIKVPATREGLEAIERLTALAVPVNATLLFSVERYLEVAEAWLRGLERCERPERAASVASFFVSRIDSKVDPLLQAHGGERARALSGRIAVANAKAAYHRFRERFSAGAFGGHAARGARVQRLLWGSTSTKNPDYPELLYVENLIGPDTVNTVPPQTLDALQRTGVTLRATLADALDRAEDELEALESLGISLAEVTAELEREGVEAFRASHDALIDALDRKRFEVTRHFAE